MVHKIRTLIEKHWAFVSYVFFGGCTTIINYGVYFPLYNLTTLSATMVDGIAWVVSVAFAFVTNKIFVFTSRDWSRRVVLPELAKFVGARLGTLLLELGILFVTVDWLSLNGNWMKLIVSAGIVIINYLCSRWLVFRKGRAS